MPFNPEAIMALAVFGGVASVCWSAAFAWAKWLQYRQDRGRTPSEVVDRLEHIERAIDTIAVEVERLGEGQRFTVKLLRDGNKLPGDRKPYGVNTPH